MGNAEYMGRSLPAVRTGGGCDTGLKDRLIMAKKKGFMTPERKKKLRTLLRKKAAEELKKEQERKAEERLRVIAARCGTKADIDNASVDDLKKICQGYEGQVHQANPQEGLQVREQVRQTAREGCQVRLRQPTEGQIKCVLSTSFQTKNTPRTTKTHSMA